jgi:hypothetical protein
MVLSIIMACVGSFESFDKLEHVVIE